MNNYILTDAISQIDIDLLAKHLKKKKKLKDKLGVRKKSNILKYSAIAACFCLICIASIPLISKKQPPPTDQNNPIIPNTNENTTSSNDTYTPNPPPNIDADQNVNISIANIYTLDEYSSLIKAKMKNIIGSYSLDPDDSTTYLLVEFNVIEDYFKKIQSDTTITIPINISTIAMTNELLTDLRCFLNDADEFILYIGRLYDTNLVYNENGIKLEINNVTSRNLMIFHSVIPIKYGVTNLSSVYNLLDKYETNYIPADKITYYSSFITDNMPYQTLDKNIKSLYNWLTTPYVPSEPSDNEDI